jgi:biotin carboxylase
MFKKILIANRGDQTARSAVAAAKLNRMVCAANTSDCATEINYV